MTGPEHYAEAERLLDQVLPDGDTDGQVVMHLRAQVHATLALAAATVATRAIGPQESWGGHAIEVGPEWQAATA